MGALWQDVRFGLRMLVKNPGFTAVAVLTLALGIGANAAIFSILDPLLLRKLPVQNPDQLVLIGTAGSQESINESEDSTFAIYRQSHPGFSDVVAYSALSNLNVMRNGETSVVHWVGVSGNYFSVLRVRPVLGRLLIDADDHATEKVIVLSFDYWSRAYGVDTAAIGKTIPFGKVSATIVGVVAPEFLGVEVGKTPDFYVPLGSTDDSWLTVIGRMKAGVSIQQAQIELQPTFQQVLARSSVPEIERPGGMARLVLTPAARGLSDLRAKFSLPAKILMTVVGLVLLISCSNVANLLFARGAARRKEISVRLALGAGRMRLVRQLVTESAMLCTLGAMVGLLAANWLSHLLVAALSTQRYPITLKTGVDGRVLLFTGAVLAITILLCGLSPAFSSTRSNLSSDLKSQSTNLGGSSSTQRTGASLVVAQVALSMAILAGAGLLLHSLVNLETFDVGFDRDHVLAVAFDGNIRRTPEQINTFYNQLIERTKNLPGVRSASFSVMTPTVHESGINVVVEGHAAVPADESHVFFTDVSPGYFETMGIVLQEGREFGSQDGGNAAPVAIINRTMAKHYFGDRSPLGQRIHFTTGRDWPTMEVVGVVADSKYNDLREQTPDFVYRNLMQTWATKSVIFGTLDVRANGNPALLGRATRDVIHSLDSSVKIASVKTVREQIDESLHQDRLIAALCGIFSLLALTLTCVGLYGTLSFSVVRRTNEIGVRMALGARPGDIFRLVIGQGMRLVIVGLVIGAAGALASASLLAKLLFGVKGADPVTFVGVSVLLIVAAILACYLPARRAMRVDPMVALRYE